MLNQIFDVDMHQAFKLGLFDFGKRVMDQHIPQIEYIMIAVMLYKHLDDKIDLFCLFKRDRLALGQ